MYFQAFMCNVDQWSLYGKQQSATDICISRPSCVMWTNGLCMENSFRCYHFCLAKNTTCLGVKQCGFSKAHYVILGSAFLMTSDSFSVGQGVR